MPRLDLSDDEAVALTKGLALELGDPSAQRRLVARAAEISLRR